MSKARLSLLDASFLHLEDASSHMHVAAALTFAGDPPAYERLLAPETLDRGPRVDHAFRPLVAGRRHRRLRRGGFACDRRVIRCA